jgi:multiple sugar transport system permease protein
MNPFRRKRLIGMVLTVATFALVVGNLLPIGWMVWCSLKDNNEIISGQVGIGKRQSEVNFLSPTDSGWFVGSSDGALAHFKAGQGGSAQVDGENFGWFTASWARAGKDLWSLSADKGLQQLDGAFEVVSRIDMGDLKDAWEVQFPNTPWQTVWVNDVQGTSLVATATKVLAALRMEKGPGVMELDRSSGKIQFHNRASGLPFMVDQVLDIPGSNDQSVVLVGNDGILGWDVRSAKSTFTHRWGQQGLPWERPAVLQPLSDSEIAFVQGAKIVIHGMDSGNKLRELGVSDGLDRGQILSLAMERDRLWAGCAQGLVAMDWRAGQPADSQAMPQENLKPLLSLDRDALGGELVKVAARDSGNVLVGGGGGEIVQLGLLGGTLVPSLKGHLPEAHFYIHWRNYVDLWRNLPFGTYLKNSLIICTSVMLISMVLATLAGYALARFEFGGKDIFGYSILATQMIPGIMFLIPLYILFTQVGEKTGVSIIGTRWGLVLLYSAFYVPFTIWILRGFFAAIPRELEEAALVDGCTPFRAFWSVIIPAAMPGIVASGIYVFLTVWDELMFAWLLTNAETSTIPVGIRLFAGNYQNRYDLMMAAATVATLPVMVLFFLMQRHIVSGLTAGAVKG